MNTVSVRRIRYPRIVWLLIGFNALLCLLVGLFIEAPLNLVFYGVALIAALQAAGFALSSITLTETELKLRHFFRTACIGRSAIVRVDSKNYRTVLVVLNNGDTRQLPAFGLDSFNTAKTLRAWTNTGNS